MRSGHSNPLINFVWYTALISYEYFSSFMMVNKNSLNQSLDLWPSSHIIVPNSLGGLIFFEGFKNVNLLSQINDYTFVD
jgi:hypothetical protein